MKSSAEYKRDHGIGLSNITRLRELLPAVNREEVPAMIEYANIIVSEVENVTHFDIRLDRPVVIDLMRQQLLPDNGWSIMCAEYGLDNREKDDEDWVGMEYEDFEGDVDDIPSDWETFEMWMPINRNWELPREVGTPPRAIKIYCPGCGHIGWMVDNTDMCPGCLDTVHDLQEITPFKDPYQQKIDDWKELTEELVDSFAVGHQFIGWILATIDTVQKKEKEEENCQKKT